MTPADYAMIDGNVGAGNGSSGGPELVVENVEDGGGSLWAGASGEQGSLAPSPRPSPLKGEGEEMPSPLPSPGVPGEGEMAGGVFSGVTIKGDLEMLGLEQGEVWEG